MQTKAPDEPAGSVAAAAARDGRPAGGPTAAETKRLILRTFGKHVGPDENQVPLPTGEQELRDLLGRANDGDRSVLPQVRELLRTVPYEAVQLFGGDLDQRAIRKVLNGCFSNPVDRMAIDAKLDALRADLTGETTTAVEKMLVEHVVRCWLEVQVTDLTVGAVRHTPLLMRRQDAAQRRFLAATRTLEDVRRKALPVLRLHAPMSAAKASG